MKELNEIALGKGLFVSIKRVTLFDGKVLG